MEYLNENNLNGMLPKTIEFKFIKKVIDLKKYFKYYRKCRLIFLIHHIRY
jgi:hypothetical protein